MLGPISKPLKKPTFNYNNNIIIIISRSSAEAPRQNTTRLVKAVKVQVSDY